MVNITNNTANLNFMNEELCITGPNFRHIFYTDFTVKVQRILIYTNFNYPYSDIHTGTGLQYIHNYILQCISLSEPKLHFHERTVFE